MILFGTVPFLLYLSILINLGLFWYVKKTLEKNSDLEEDVEEIMDKTSNFSDHLEGIHELEMYYGDENLQNMIRHSKELINNFIDFQLKYFDTEENFDPDPEEKTPEEEE
jgi:tRNA A-37 threonylcarbamoyl transferase component Bud32